MSSALRRAVVAASAALLATSLAFTGGVTTSATAATSVPDSSCRAYDPNLRDGQCLRTVDGRVTWLGNFTAKNKAVFWCIDKGLDSNLPTGGKYVSTQNLKNQFGTSIGDATVAALNYVVWKWGEGAGDNHAAAIAYIVRQVMSDTGGQFPSGLKAGGDVLDMAGGAPKAILSSARNMWDEASKFRGPWTVKTGGDTTTEFQIGVPRTLRVVVKAASGRVVPNATINLAYANMDGPVALKTNANAGIDFTVTPRGGPEATFTASVNGPAGDGQLYVPGGKYQRGWVAVATSSVANETIRAASVINTPRAFTSTSAKQAKPGDPFHDVVEIVDYLGSDAMNVDSELYGPYQTPPTLNDCAPAQLVSRQRYVITGNGTYRTPDVAVSAEGYYVWVQRLEGNASNSGVVTACGIAAETTLVTKPLAPLTLSSKVSDRQVEVGDVVTDTVTVEGIDAARAVLQKPLDEAAQATADAAARAACIASLPSAYVVRAGGRLDTDGDGIPDVVEQATGPLATPVYVEWEHHRSGRKDGMWLTEGPGTSWRDLDSDRDGWPDGVELVLGTDPLVADPPPATDCSTRTAAPTTGSPVVMDDVTIDWIAYGPVPALVDAKGNETCEGLDHASGVWDSAPIAGSGTITVAADGDYDVTPYATPQAGCYTYADYASATNEMAPFDHLPGESSQTVLAVKRLPTLATAISTQRAAIGRTLSDTITVTNLGSNVADLEWTAWGPITPSAEGDCVGLDWSDAPILGFGTLSVNGDGVYTTPQTDPVPKMGCISFSEVLAGGVNSHSVDHPVGLPSQTALARKSAPTVTTLISREYTSPGKRVHDSVVVSGLADGDSVRIKWVLWGPAKQVKHGCARVNWKKVIRKEKLRFQEGWLTVNRDGIYKTPKSKKLKKAGCYSYAEYVEATPTSDGFDHPAGAVSQTVHVTKFLRVVVNAGYASKHKINIFKKAKGF